MTKITLSSIFQKNIISAIAGFPIAFAVNLFLLPNLIELVEWHWLLGTLALGAPYFAVSVIRMTAFDWTFEKYGINLDIGFYIKKRLNKR